MAIFLVQHGKCLSKDIDPDRSLSEKGISEVEIIASVAKNYKVPVSVIAHSGKKRAAQTAEIFAKYLQPPKGITMFEGIKPMDNVQTFAATLDGSQNIMIVGHLPFLEKLISFMVAENEDICVFKLQNGGMVCLDHTPENGWFIRWAFMPDLSLQA